jgi:dTDP-4-amino-4,6-dideoxygalactose transaminase
MTDTTALRQILFLDLTAQNAPLKDEIDKAVSSIFTDSSFILGPEVDRFERNFAAYLGVKHCIAVHNGTAALHLAMLALGVGAGDEVITSPNSFIATAEAISFCGATARFVDADLKTANIDVSLIEKAINKNTKVLMPVHLYGQPAQMDAVNELAAAHGLRVIEDACQSHGATFKGIKAGALSDVACFSFYPGKNLGAAGDGGAVVTNDGEIAEKVRLIRSHGSEQKYHHLVIGYNFRLDSIQAAVLRIKLPHLDRWNEKRKEIAAFYTQELKNLPGIELIEQIAMAESSFHLYVIRADKRAVVEEVLRQSKIQYGIHYPVPIHLQPAYRSMNLGRGSFPISEQLAESIISLPIYPELSKPDQERVVAAVQQASQLMQDHQ